MPLSRFWVGGSGNWSDPAHWSASPNGAGGASVPGPNVAVFLPPTADTITLDTAAACLSMAPGSFSGTIDGPGSITITNGGFFLNSPAAWRATGDIRLKGALGQIRTSGNTLPSMTLDGSSPSSVLTQLDDLSIAGDLTILQGSINSNGFALTHR